MSLLPPFTDDGLLPAGDYELTFDQLLASSLATGRAEAPEWAGEWRRKLVENLRVLAGQLVRVGVTDIFIDGSFVENKSVPNDIDGYFVCDPERWWRGEIRRALQEIDPIWTWAGETRARFRGYAKPQLPMWHKYRVELFPHYGQLCGIRDNSGHELTFPSAFRQSREFKPKGIIKLGGLS
ncbi:MAG: DUF6932 family protein [Tepidisphaerales bacterium]